MYSLARKFFLAGAVALSAVAGNAATVTATYTGTIGQGFDRVDVFGLGENVDLSGVAFTLVFIYDTLIGQDLTNPNAEEIYGGPFDPIAGHETSPISLAELTINGIGVGWNSSAYNQVKAFGDGVQNYIRHFAGGMDRTEGFISITESSLTNAIAVDLDAPQEIDGSGMTNPFERIEIEPFHVLHNFDQGSFRYNADEAAGSFKVDHLSITVSSVPLPGALPLFLVALLGLGMVRRRAG